MQAIPLQMLRAILRFQINQATASQVKVMITKNANLAKTFTLIFFLTVYSSVCFAESVISIESTLGATDNIAKTSENEDAAGIASVGLAFEFDEQSNRLEATGRGGIYYVDYFKASAYDDETLGYLDATAVLTMKKDLLTWMVQDTFGQQLANSFEPSTPGNRENINYFTTGPDMQLRLGDRTAFLAGARYSDVSYETTPLDNTRTGGTLGIERQISSSKAVSLNAGADQVAYDSDLYTDFDSNRVYLRFETEAARTSLGISAGWNEVKSDASSGDGLLLDFSVTRKISGFTSVSGAVGTKYSDAGDIFRFYQEGGMNPGDSQDVEGQGSPFENRYATFAVNYTGNRTTFVGSIGYSDEDYVEVNAPDRMRIDMYGTLTRQLRSNFDFSVGGNIYYRRYDATDRKDTDWAIHGSLIWRYSRTLTGTIKYNHYDRNSNAAGARYLENGLYVTVAYSPMR